MKALFDNPAVVGALIGGIAVIVNGIFTCLVLLLNSYLDRKARADLEQQKKDDILINSVGKLYGIDLGNKYSEALSYKEMGKLMIEQMFDKKRGEELIKTFDSLEEAFCKHSKEQSKS